MKEETIRIHEQSKPLKACIQILQATGARIREVLELEWEDVSETGHIYLAGSKGSGDRIAHSGEASEWLLSQRSNKRGKIFHLSYMYVYRYLKAKGLYEYYGSNVNASVTHSFRHKLAKSFSKKPKNQDAVKSLLNHKNGKSTETYTNKPARPKRG